MNIVVALSRFPLPTDKGDKLRAYYQIRHLAQKHQIHLICLNDAPIAPEDLQAMQEICASIEVIQLGKLKKLFNLAGSLFNRLPFQVNYFRSVRMKKVLEEKIKSTRAEVCYVQLIRLAKNIPFHDNTAYFLDYMDAFSVGMENRISLSPWYLKPFVKIEARRLQEFEAKVAVPYDGFSIISEQDAAVLPDLLKNEIAIIRNGVGEMFFEELPVVNKDFDLLFTGNLGYHPNEKAALYLVNEILPELEKKGIKATVCLAGARPAPAVRALASERVTVTGRVPDLREYFNRSRLYVAPLISGQGLQNKLLESMAMGLPTMTSPGPNAALGAAPGKEILVANDAADFANKIKKMLADPEEAQKIAKAGRAFVKNHYHWDGVNQQLEDLLIGIAARR